MQVKEMFDADSNMPRSEVYDAVTLTDLITRFVALLEVYSANTLGLTATWLEKIRRQNEGDASLIRDQYILTTAIDALRNAQAQDLNGSPQMERTPQAELEVLRVSLARVAQAAGVQSDNLPVVAKSSYIELLNLARSGARGWNMLASYIEAKIREERANNARALREAIEEIRAAVRRGGHVYSIAKLQMLAPFFANQHPANMHYQHAVNSLTQRNLAMSTLHLDAVIDVLRRIERGE